MRKKRKELRITEADFMLANRRAARLEEIAEHGRPFPSGRPFINPRRSTTGNALNGWNKTSPISRSSRTLERETSLFFLPGDYPSRQRNRAGRTSPDVMLPLYAPVSGAAGPISAPVGEPGDPSLGLRPGRGAASSFAVVPALFPLYAVLSGR